MGCGLPTRLGRLTIPLADLLAILATALASALVVGALGLVALHLLRRSPIIVQLSVVVLAAVFSLAGGVLAVAQQMYISEHDLIVVITVTICAAVVTLFVALILGLRMSRTGREIRHLAQHLSDGEVLDKSGVSTSSREFERLADELAATSRRLVEAREEVAAIDASRRELIAWISHDLRTPLSGLRAMAEALDEGMAADPERFHHQMRLQVNDLTLLVDNLFELSKINAGTLALSFETMSLHDLVSDSVAELTAVASKKRIRIVERTSPDHTVLGDPREIARVVSNLLMNALEHTESGGEIIIDTSREHGHIRLAVQDSGGGIHADDLKRVFEAGWRGTPARTPHTPTVPTSGAGLGLAIVRGIVEAHDGAVTVANTDTGCRFEVALPIGQGPASDRAASRV